MMAPKLRFSRGLKAKAPGAVTACVPARSDAARRNFYRPVDHDWHKKQRWGRWRFFFFTFEGLSSVWLLFYQRSDTALLLGISPDSWLAMFHSQRSSYIRTDDPSTKAMARRAFTVSWNVEVFVHSRSVVISPQASPSLVSSPSKYPPSFALAFNKTKPAELSPRSPSQRKPSNVQLVPACRIWEQPQRCFPPFGQKPREA